ncbi:hypothetical protein [Desulforegula conservatrix]|uniref:hypothetical protein n=1 Tax=Desulforegula conservatrix TaxID=153026 RepID=UPI000485CEF1|nr:hypothetical protein [Desulforegula conservatrix]
MQNTSDNKKLSYREKKERQKTRSCHCCKVISSFSWYCRCGFTICQDCMKETAWGLSCNGITWVCPDCGEQNGYGNQ